MGDSNFMIKVKKIQAIIDTIDEIPIDMEIVMKRDKVITQLKFIKRKDIFGDDIK